MPNPLDPPGSGRPNGHFAGNGLPDPGGSSGLGIFSSPQNAQLCFQVVHCFVYQGPAGEAGEAFFEVLRSPNL